MDYFDQIKIFTKTEEAHSEMNIVTYPMRSRKEIELKKTDDQQFFVWRSYTDTRWKLDKKVPLMVFASSWEDKRFGFHRFCGVVHLAEDDARTEELLTSSPNYIVLNYLVREIQSD